MLNASNNALKKQNRHLIFVIDTSSGMAGEPIAEVNGAMSSIINDLPCDSCIQGMPDIYISVLTYNNVFGHVLTAPVFAFPWHDRHIDTEPHISYALEELNNLLTTYAENEMYSDDNPPVVICIHRCKQIGFEWYNELESLYKNDWYVKAIKMAIAYKSGDEDSLVDIVGNREHIYVANNLTELKSRLWKRISCGVEIPSLFIKNVIMQDYQDGPDLENAAYPSHEEDLLRGSRIVAPTAVGNEYGRAKCKLLKTIRKVIADANGIPYEINECDSTGHCIGACSACDQEAVDLSQSLSQIARSGKQIQMPGMETSLLDDYLPITSDIYDYSEYGDEPSCGWIDIGW